MSSKLPFNKNYKKGVDIFCKKCLTHERHFKGGQSWTPDLCPCGCEDVVVWWKMDIIQKVRAQKIYNRHERMRSTRQV